MSFTHSIIITWLDMTFLRVLWLIVSLQLVIGLSKAIDVESTLDLVSSLRHELLFPDKALNLSDLGEQCRTHIEAYQSKIVSPIAGPPGLWALKMLDATGKLPEGILTGNTYALGDYSTCMDINVPGFEWQGSPTEGFRGRYMRIVMIPFGRASEGKSPMMKNPLIRGFNTWGSDHFRTVYASHVENRTSKGASSPALAGVLLHFGVCLPSSCSDFEVTSFVQNAIDSVPLLEILKFALIGFPSHSRADVKSFEVIDIFFIVLVSVIGITILCGTSLDAYFIYTGKDSNASNTILADLLVGFSLYKNTKALCTVTPKNTKRDLLTCINGIRFLSMTWVIIGHAYGEVSGLYFPSSNLATFATLVFESFWARVLLNAFPSVDSFFLLSGLLVTYLTLKELDKTKGKLNWAMFYIHRYLRLTGMYAFVILFHMSLSSFFDSGPNSFVKSVRSDCQKAWWRNILYINNLNYRGHYNVETMDEMCLGQTWYLSNDMQMFLVAPIFIYTLWRSKVVGLILTGFVTIISALVPFALTFTNNWPATVILDTVPPTDYFASNYVIPWCRFSPYIVGILVGYALYLTKDKKINISKEVNAICWLLAVATGVAVIYGLDLSRVLTQNYYPVLTNAFYGGFHRLAWGAAVGWVVFACSRGYGGWVNDFLSWGPFEPLSRLCYNIYLIHMTILSLLTNPLASTSVITHLLVVNKLITVTVLSTLVSVVLYVCVELPWGNTEKIIFESLLGKRRAKPKSS